MKESEENQFSTPGFWKTEGSENRSRKVWGLLPRLKRGLQTQREKLRSGGAKARVTRDKEPSRPDTDQTSNLRVRHGEALEGPVRVKPWTGLGSTSMSKCVF